MLSDAQLTDEWEAGALGRSISHEEHLRIARILVRKHGRSEAARRLVVGTRLNCELMACPERFDAELTRRWSAAVSDALEADDDTTFEGFIALHPELRRSDLLGLPAWKLEE